MGGGIWWLGREPNSTEIDYKSSSYADSTLTDTNKVPAKMKGWDGVVGVGGSTDMLSRIPQLGNIPDAISRARYKKAAQAAAGDF